MLTTTTTHLPITLSLHVTIIVVVGILYLEGREGKGREVLASVINEMKIIV